MNKAEQAHWDQLGHPAVIDTAILLEAIATKGVTRRYIAGLYGISIRLQFGLTDWSVVNHAIMTRWSYSGLQWIKNLATRAVEEAVTV